MLQALRNKTQNVAARARHAFSRNRGVVIALPLAAVAGSRASAQTQAAAAIDYSALITPVTSGMIGSINASGPLLFGFVAVIGGFYFVWGRIRSLW